MPSAWCEAGLSRRFWPLRLKPYTEELLASWVVRLSRMYGMDASRFGAVVVRSDFEDFGVTSNLGQLPDFLDSRYVCA